MRDKLGRRRVIHTGWTYSRLLWLDVAFEGGGSVVGGPGTASTLLKW